MRGVQAFAVLASSALAALSPLEAVAWDGRAQAHATQTLEVASPGLRAAALAVLLLGALCLSRGWYRREAALVQGAPTTPERDIDAAWLERHVFSLSPELAGAVYDGRVAGPEVAAVLARLCGQSKLASRVATGARGWNNLELWLLVERGELAGYERDLVDQLFGTGKTTSGDLIRQQHGDGGFDPAAILRAPLSAARDAALGVQRARRWPFALGAAVLGLSLGMAANGSSALPVLLAAALAALGPVCGSVVFAPRYRRDAARSPQSARRCAVSAAAGVVPLAVLIAAMPSLSPFAAFALAGWGLLGAALVASAAASRESASGLQTRRHLLAARRFFAAELERPEPRVPDEWLPYLIALELAPEIDRWYQAFGRIETAARRQRLARRADSAQDADAACWTGGAGALGGIGPSGPWIAAAAGLTATPARERRAPSIARARALQLKQA